MEDADSQTLVFAEGDGGTRDEEQMRIWSEKPCMRMPRSIAPVRYIARRTFTRGWTDWRKVARRQARSRGDGSRFGNGCCAIVIPVLAEIGQVGPRLDSYASNGHIDAYENDRHSG